jgi:trans-aconitate 2-methyltransferase
VTADAWNPAQYDRYRDERRQPFFDLLALVEARPGMRVVDLGCGTGEPTRQLHDRLGARETVGLDSSAAMLEQCRAFAGGGVRFAAGDIATFSAPGAYDLVFTNAALHWVPDHPALFARLTEALADGGQLAVQMPSNPEAPSHVAAVEVASEEPFRTALGGDVVPAGDQNVLAPEAYARLLDRLGYRRQHVRLQVYGHQLGGREDVVEWVRGTTLTHYQRRLPAELFERFLAEYRGRLLPRLEDTHPFFYPFARVHLWAAR